MTVSSDKPELPGLLLRSVGYVLLILALINLLDILIPLKLMEPSWEFQTFGAIVDSTPLLLMGFAFVFYGKLENRHPLELLVLNFLSWCTLITAIFLFLLIPFGLSSAIWVNRQIHAQLNFQSQQQVAQLTQLQTQLNQATDAQLNVLLNRVAQEPGGSGIKTTQDLKDRFQANLGEIEKKSKAEAEAQHTARRSELVKRCAKGSLGALISGFTLILMWRSTRWIRAVFKRKA